jgi:hypothetical protein
MRLFLLALTIAPLTLANVARADIHMSDGDSITLGGETVTCGAAASTTRVGCFCRENPSIEGQLGYRSAIIHAIDVQTGTELWSRFLAGNPNFNLGFEWCATNAQPTSCNPAETPYHSDADANKACEELIRQSTECH